LDGVSPVGQKRPIAEARATAIEPVRLSTPRRPEGHQPMSVLLSVPSDHETNHALHATRTSAGVARERPGALDPRPTSWVRCALNPRDFVVAAATKSLGEARMCHHSAIADSRPGQLSSSAPEA
jgi:hypothetical protein